MNFEELCLDTRILRAITEMGFEQASPIQAQAIPVAIEGKDMIGQAQTGTAVSYTHLRAHETGA